MLYKNISIVMDVHVRLEMCTFLILLDLSNILYFPTISTFYEQDLGFEFSQKKHLEQHYFLYMYGLVHYKSLKPNLMITKNQTLKKNRENFQVPTTSYDI